VKQTLFYQDKPLFGLDIGHGKVRVAQLHPGKHRPQLVGYGEITFDPGAIQGDGTIGKPEVIAKAALELFRHHLVGDVTTNRVALSVPVAHTFTRSIEVPNLKQKELNEAVQNEVTQYIPAAIDDLYVDYTRTKSSGDTTTVFIVAMPKRVIDSYLTLSRLLGLETIAIQTSSGAGAQLFAHDGQSDVPTLLIDFGSESADITIYDQGAAVSGTVASGSDLFTTAIAKALNVSEKEATLIKAKYGLGVSKKQDQIEKALEPTLSLLIREIKRTVRYYEEHNHDKQKITQVIIAGGGANMPGLADYLTSNLRLAVRAFDPTSYIDFSRLQPFNTTERMSFVTAVGLAIIDPSEVFAS